MKAKVRLIPVCNKPTIKVYGDSVWIHNVRCNNLLSLRTIHVGATYVSTKSMISPKHKPVI